MWEQAASPWAAQSKSSAAFRFLESSFDINSFAPDLVERVKSRCEAVLSLEAFRNTSLAVRKLMHTDATESFRTLDSIGDFQFANETLQPFLVSMPEYCSLYRDGLAAGFENGFSTLDRFRGNAYMHTDDNYREITSDMVSEYEDKIMHWVSNEDRAFRPTTINKVENQINWSRMADFDWEDEDPCSELGATC